ncbi:MAG: Na/Pi cotransporter family protein [Gammaproteobacteria bacterium]|nr:Na/Pi cotransporter family protein [Gammaproteobacteria bacterium]
MILFLMFLVTITSSVTFASAAETDISWSVMAMKLFGGLALFLFGMEQMAESLKAVAGERMKNILATLTKNRFTGAITGAFVTAVIQSSSVTTVLVVGFISAGLMNLTQSVGIIMGANVGTTITAQIVAFKVTKAALLMIGAGFFTLLLGKTEKIKYYGTMLMGLGMIFFGMSVMSEAMKPLRTYEPFLDLMVHMETPLLGILIAAAFTGLIQSSSATTGIVIVMASQGLITLPAGIALAFGANVGTCITAMLASIGKSREALQAAFIHVIFNIAGVVLWIAFIDNLAEVVTFLSPAHTELSGMERLAADTPRQIANAHSIFNIANTLIFIGFSGLLARLVMWLFPERPEEPGAEVIRPKYLDEELLSTPSLALDRARMEVLHTGEQVEYMMREILPAINSNNQQLLREVAKMDDRVDILHLSIVNYLGILSKEKLTKKQSRKLLALMEAVNDLENIGDVIETNMVAAGHALIDDHLIISQDTKNVINNLHEQIEKSVELAVQAVSQNNKVAASMVIQMKIPVSETVASAGVHLSERLVADEPDRVAIYTAEVQLIENMKRIYYFAKRMAKTILPNET